MGDTNGTPPKDSAVKRLGADNIMSDVQRGLAWFIVGAFILLLFVWVFKPPTMAPESMAQLNQMCGTLQNILLIAIGFFFGSSKASQNKDDAMIGKILDPGASSTGVGSVSATISATTTTDGGDTK